MNHERLTAIAVWLEAGAPHEHITFNMSYGILIPTRHLESMKPTDIHKCETSCCIAGYAVMEFNEPQELVDAEPDWKFEDYIEVDLPFAGASGIFSKARDLLDLDVEDAKRLFCPHEYSPYPLSEYTNPAWAARTIRHLMATGRVDWNFTMDETTRERLEARYGGVA